jgi:transcriptional regulator with XRE-family HTH domain
MKLKPPCLVLIGKNIKKSGQLQGLSQEEIAFRAGLALSYYGRIERGEQNPSLINFLRIAVALNEEIKELIPSIPILSKLITDN